MNEFNASATPPEEIRRKLLYHAMTGNEMVASGFSIPEAFSPEAIEKKDREFYAQMRLMLASQERVEQFTQTLDQLTEANAKALEEIREELRHTESKIQRIKDEAPEALFPDGTRRKVFRDHDRVRDEDGRFVSRNIAKAEYVSKNPHHWSGLKGFMDHRTDLKGRESVSVKYDEKIKRTLKRKSEFTEDEIEKLEAEAKATLPDHARRFLKTEPAATAQTTVRTGPAAREYVDGGLQTNTTPTADFTVVAAPVPGITARTMDDDLRPQGPAAVTPAPG